MNIVAGLKRVLVGRRLSNSQLGETLLPRRLALPVFASDALSSVAYAPDEILITLALAGMTGYLFSWQIGLAVGLVIAIVVLSYRQTVRAYPSGGGDYEVAAANLGRHAAVTVASALLVDYVLTVAVSVSAGVLQAKAILPWLEGIETPVAVGVIGCLALINLRGMRPSAGVFAWPTYLFVFSMLMMVVIGLIRILVLGQPLRSETAHLVVVNPEGSTTAAGWLLVAVITRAFSSGCAALTGVEAVAAGVPAFRPPKSRNAATVLATLAAIAVPMFVGIVALARLTDVHLIDELTGAHYVAPDGSTIHNAAVTVTGQLARTVFGDWFAPGFYVVVLAAIAILLLAANTPFNGFPGLASILAKDGYLPRQLHARGDRLAHSNGIISLAIAAILLVVVFDASVTALIQLYVVGVFISFTLGQAGMVRHWTKALRTELDRGKRARMQRSRVINLIGTACTGTVLAVVLVSKFTHGAWLALLAMAAVFLAMLKVHQHYNQVREELALDAGTDRILPSRVHAVVLVQHINRPTAKAIAYAKASRATTLTGVTIAVDNEETRDVVAAWDEEDFGIPLRVIASPYREITQPFLRFVSELRSENPRDVVAVYIPDYVVGRWWERVLHNQSSRLIRDRLHVMKGVMVISVPYQLSSSLRRPENQARRS
ncbi:APC family permease [Arachnia propionica]|uniref:APC family permease n=1 Tax=Arachnia propionica TaxID=1750 RepID=A0A3P1WY19_9ACTN|nr:APC family permease [Arachnia propionica]RRD51131.1 APC family permease [Arachnia propionica]